jgi:L-ribulose-5-phosphate 3-epimerase UlaE
VIFDLFNYLDAENQHDYLSILEEGLQTFAGEILLFHMKDCLFNESGKPQQVPFGTGDLDLEAVLGRIKKYDENAVLTLEGTTGNDIQFAVNTIKTIWERV